MKVKYAGLFLCIAAAVLLLFAGCEQHEHTFGEWTTAKPATCSATGEEVRSCSCGAQETKAIEMIAHNFAAATCTAPKTCTACKATEGAAKGHTFSAATCTAPKTCTVCNATEGAAKGHTFSAATCSAPKKCSTCGLTEGTVIDHKYVDGKCSMCKAADPKVQQKDDASYAYSYLMIVEGYCDLISQQLYDAWYFAIYKADDYTTASSMITAFSKRVGISTDLVTEAVDSYLTSAGYGTSDIYRRAALSTNGGAIYVVKYAMTKGGQYDNAKKALASAKDYFQKLNSSYASVNAYSEISSYYSAANAYLDFCISPSGSFSTLSSTLSTFRNNCADYRNKCDLYF